MTRTSPLTLWFGLLIVASLLLYHTSDRVEALNHQLRTINESIAAERESIHVLKAEWAYLSDPARIASASERHLPLRPTSAQQIISMNDLSDVLPTKSEAMASVVINGTPIASIHSTLATPRMRVANATAPKKAAHASNGYLNDHMIMQKTASASMLPPTMTIDENGTHQ